MSDSEASMYSDAESGGAESEVIINYPALFLHIK